MRFLWGFSFVWVISVIGVNGQNLCTNGDFDTFTTLPNNYAQVCYANGWTSPSGICALVVGTGSPDYYNVGGTGGCKPPATWWATVSPHSGTGMEGFAAWYSGNYREYISRQLSSPLIIGQLYTVSFWYTNGVSTIHGYGCNNLGVAFSSAPLTQSGGNPISYVPQLESSAILYSTTWQRLAFLYTPATADQYLTIGNFRTNALTSISLLGTGTTGAYYYIDDVSVSPGNSLPVELIAFTAEKNDQHVDLHWTTASEIQNQYFSIERSIDGTSFEAIGRMNGAGNSTTLNEYSFSDEQPWKGINYYRLAQTDIDGTVNYSRIVACRMKGDRNISWNYQEHEHILKFFFNELYNYRPQVRLYDMTGKIVYASQALSNQNLEISTLEFTSGLYGIAVDSEDEHCSGTFFVSHN